MSPLMVACAPQAAYSDSIDDEFSACWGKRCIAGTVGDNAKGFLEKNSVIGCKSPVGSIT